MSDVLVSIVIPAYNAADHISEAIKSALSQTLDDLEVLVIDDGSSDETASRVKELSDSRLRLFHQENQGQSAAINAGVQKARGAYIKLLDADDWINPRHLESQLRAIDGRFGLLASCKWGHFVEYCTKPAVRDEATHKDYDDPLEWIVDSLKCDEGMMGGWMWLIPRPLWGRAGGFDPRLSLNNDFHFSVRLLLASQGVRFAGDAVYSYRKGLTSALSGSCGRRAMESAYLTTDLGTRLLLKREDSPRIRKICADRFQQWLFRFYPQHPDLAAKAQTQIEALGGSELELEGGVALRLLEPVVGWKAVRRIQEFAYRHGWQRVLRAKSVRRLRSLK